MSPNDYSWPCRNSWEHTWDICKRVNRPNFGLCLDTFQISSLSPFLNTHHFIHSHHNQLRTSLPRSAFQALSPPPQSPRPQIPYRTPSHPSQKSSLHTPIRSSTSRSATVRVSSRMCSQKRQKRSSSTHCTRTQTHTGLCHSRAWRGQGSYPSSMLLERF